MMVSHIYRQGNSIADILASHAYSHRSDCIIEAASFLLQTSLLQRQKARPTWWPVALRLLDNYNRTVIMSVEKQNNDEDDGVVVYDCIVCLCEVSLRDEYKMLPNCDHGVQFHAHCIAAWLKDHSICPMCRSRIPRPLSQRLHNYLCERLLEEVVSYCNSALNNVASSIEDCHVF
ncbi:zinc finger, RING/FYVE/PHD-type containing protein [Tanacetum coccineum]